MKSLVVSALAANLLFALMTVINAQTADPYLGTKVFWKDEAIAKIGDTVIADKFKVLDWPATVEAVKANGYGWDERGYASRIAEHFRRHSTTTLMK